ARGRARRARVGRSAGQRVPPVLAVARRRRVRPRQSPHRRGVLSAALAQPPDRTLARNAPSRRARNQRGNRCRRRRRVRGERPRHDRGRGARRDAARSRRAARAARGAHRRTADGVSGPPRPRDAASALARARQRRLMLRVLTNQWELKLVATIVAFTLWFFVATSEQAQLTLPAPVEYIGLSPTFVLVAGQRESVDVEIRAARSLVAKLGSETVHVRVDLAGLGEGESTVQLTPLDVQLPAGATVRRITPGQLRLTVAAAATGRASVVP